MITISTKQFICTFSVWAVLAVYGLCLRCMGSACGVWAVLAVYGLYLRCMGCACGVWYVVAVYWLYLWCSMGCTWGTLWVNCMYVHSWHCVQLVSLVMVCGAACPVRCFDSDGDTEVRLLYWTLYPYYCQVGFVMINISVSPGEPHSHSWNLFMLWFMPSN